MTREQFMEGAEFKLPFTTSTFFMEVDSISRVYKTTDLTRNIMVDYEANILKVGKKSFTAYRFILGKKIQVTHKFEDLALWGE